MERYEGATMIKTFRGLIADAAQDTIVLHTNDGSTGYRIVKFEIIDKAPGTANLENVVKIYTVSQTTGGLSVDGVIDFSDNTLLGCAFWTYSGSNPTYSTPYQIIFDQMVFNQDIYVTHKDVSANANPSNYYIELEQVKLDLSENIVATLKNLKNLEPGG